MSNIENEPTIVMPIPDGHPFPFDEPKAAAVYRYYNDKEQLLGLILRHETQNNKQFYPITLWQKPDGSLHWQKKTWPDSRPLYGLNRLASRPSAAVIVVEGEKPTDALQKLLPDCVVITSSGGANSAHKSDWSPLFERDVTIWPDKDENGFKYQERVAGLLQAAGARSIRVCEPLDAWPAKFDAADLPQDTSGATIAQNLIRAAVAYVEARHDESLALTQASTDTAPLPLCGTSIERVAFPLERMGVLQAATATIADVVQAPVAMVASSLLCVAALAVQGHADVEMKTGLKVPLSLFFMTIGESGERKSTVDYHATKPVKNYMESQEESYGHSKRVYERDIAAWRGHKDSIHKKPKLSLDERRLEIEAMGEEPKEPIKPTYLIPTTTIEGLTKAWTYLPPSLAMINGEGGSFLNAHGMKAENKTHTTTNLTGLWDGNGLARITAGEGANEAQGKRLSLHLMVQPRIGYAFFQDEEMKDQGFTNRFLIAAPESLAGTRLDNEPTFEQLTTLKAYDNLIEMAMRLKPTIEPKGNRLKPRKLTLENDAKLILREFRQEVEKEQGIGGKYAEIKGFASRLGEHACRLAGVLQLIEDPQSQEINGVAMFNGVELAKWFMHERLRLTSENAISLEIKAAQKLLAWVQKTGESTITKKAIMQRGPHDLRPKAAVEPTLKMLVEYGWLIKTSDKVETYSLIGEIK